MVMAWPTVRFTFLLKDRGKTLLADGEGVAPWRKTQEGEMTVRICGIRLYEIGR